MNTTISNMISSLATTGTFEDTVTVGDVTFEISVLDTNDSILADALSDVEEVHKRLAGEKSDALNVYNYSFETVRSATRMAIFIRSMNGEVPVKTEGTEAEYIKSIQEFRYELLRLDGVIMDKINQKYNKLLEARSKFFDTPEETLKK